VLERLRRLSALRFVSLDYCATTPATADLLADLQQLKSLHVGQPVANWPGRPTNLAWIGKLRHLEELSLERAASDELACLADLRQLKSLTLDLTDCIHDESETDRRLAAVGKLTWLRRLTLQGSPGAQIAHLGGLTSLRSLAVDFHHFNGDEERLRRCFAAIGTLTQVEVLRLLTPSGPLHVRADNLESLRGMKNLTSLWLLISCDKAERQACLAALSKLTQLRRLWLEGDLVTTGLGELAPLGSLEELLISDSGMETPAAVESLYALKGLKAVHIPALAFDFYSSDEAAGAHCALESYQRSHRGRVSNLWREWQNDPRWGTPPRFVDEPLDVNSFWQPFDGKPPNLDSFLGGNPAAP
jgi:Leucine-rich repeat (LRR) protein